MTKVTLDDIAGGLGDVSTINNNWATIETAFDNTLSRDGSTPNSMGANIDMNSYKVINVADGTLSADAVNLKQLQAAAVETDIPSQAGNSGKFLSTDGTVLSWQDSTSDLVNDTTPQLGGDLDLNGNSIDFPSTANISDCLDEDTMSSNSATALATQQSIKAYVDASNVPATDDSTDLGSSSNRWQDLYLSGNIYLGGTGSANALADYEIGDWTPALTSTGASFTYTSQVGRYIKIGKLVFLEFRINLSNAPSGTTSNQVFISGIPFTMETVTDMFFASAGLYFFFVDLATNYTDIRLQGGSNANSITLVQIGDNQGQQALNANQLVGSGTELRGTFIYISA